LPRDGSRELPSWGQVLSRAFERRLRPLAPSPARPLHRRNRTVREPRGSASRGVLAPTDTVYVGCPFSATRFLAVARVGRRSPNPRRCRPQGSCPSRRFRLTRDSLEAFWASPFVVVPDASRPCSMPLASLERPSRAFPSRGAVPALAGLLLPCGFAFDCRRRSACGRLTIAFTCSSRLFARSNPPEGGPGTHEPGRSSLRSLGRSPRRALGAPHVPSLSHRHWARRLAAGTPASKLCSPRESVPRRPLRLARLRPPVGALVGFSTLQSFLHHGSGFGLSRRPTQEARGLMPRGSPGAQPSRLHAATRTPTPELASPGFVDAQGL